MKTFDPILAARCAEMSARAYREYTINGARSTQVLVEEVSGLEFEVSSSGNQKSATSKSKPILVAFRGSRELMDFVTDGEAWLTKRAFGGIHHGFDDAFMGVADALREAIEPGRPVIFTGHSLGGALAMLAAIHFKGLAEVEAVYTFGQPRTGDGVFAHNYETALGNRTFRAVHEEDVVPRLPGVLMGYRHAGQEIFLPSAKDLGFRVSSFGFQKADDLSPVRLQPGYILNPTWIQKAASDVRGLWKEWRRNGPLGLAELLVDHGVEHYVSRMTALAVANERALSAEQEFMAARFSNSRGPGANAPGATKSKEVL